MYRHLLYLLNVPPPPHTHTHNTVPTHMAVYVDVAIDKCTILERTTYGMAKDHLSYHNLIVAAPIWGVVFKWEKDYDSRTTPRMLRILN